MMQQGHSLRRLVPILWVVAGLAWSCNPSTAQVAGRPATGADPEINRRFLDPELDVDKWIGRFEVESREVFSARGEVMTTLGVASGDRIADVGAGTGLYTRLFSSAVGEAGWVYAVDISPRFIEHINRLARDDGLRNVTGVLSRGDSVMLPPASVDKAFVCDTYHHFETPQSTLASIRRALRPGGELVVIDFIRIEGQSTDFVIGHVRAGKEVFRAEIEAAGFELVAEIPIEGFEENYFLKFRRP